MRSFVFLTGFLGFGSTCEFLRLFRFAVYQHSSCSVVVSYCMFIPVFVIFLLSLTVFQWLKRVNSVCDNKLLRSVVGYNQNLLPQGGEFPADEHFNLRDHNKIQDMRVSVVRQVLDGTAVTQREKMRLIFLLGTLGPGALNIGFEFN